MNIGFWLREGILGYQWHNVCMLKKCGKACLVVHPMGNRQFS